MKRFAVADDAVQRDKKVRRSTRIKSLVAHCVHGLQTVGPSKDAMEKQRAQELMATPQLLALPLVLAKSGFLYKHECHNAAAVSTKWNDIWREVEYDLPHECQVEIQLFLDNPDSEWPRWVECRGLQNDLWSQAFVRQVLAKANDLRVAAKRSESEKRKYTETLPKWGIDFHRVDVLVFGPNPDNDGGVMFRLFKHSPRFTSSVRTCWTQLRGWGIVLDVDLRIRVGLGKRAHMLYERYPEPLWDWEFVSLPSVSLLQHILRQLLRVQGEDDEDEEDPDGADAGPADPLAGGADQDAPVPVLADPVVPEANETAI